MLAWNSHAWARFYTLFRSITFKSPSRTIKSIPHTFKSRFIDNYKQQSHQSMQSMPLGSRPHFSSANARLLATLAHAVVTPRLLHVGMGHANVKPAIMSFLLRVKSGFLIYWTQQPNKLLHAIPPHTGSIKQVSYPQICNKIVDNLLLKKIRALKTNTWTIKLHHAKSVALYSLFLISQPGCQLFFLHSL